MQPRRALRLSLAVFAIALAYAMFFHDKGVVMNEEGQILAEAEAVHAGRLLYRDVDCFVSPGVWYVTAGIFELFGTSVNATRVAMAVLFAATTLIVFRIGLRIATPGFAVFGAGLMLLHKLLVWPGGNFIFYTEFAVFAAVLTLWALIVFEQGGRLAALAAAGLALGACALFKQNLGVVLGAVCGLWLLVFRRSARTLACFAAPAAASVLLMVAAFAAQGALADLWHGLVVEPLTGFGEHASFAPLPVHRLASLSALERIVYLPGLFGEIVFGGATPRSSGPFVLAAKAIALLVYALPLWLGGALLLRALRRGRLLASEGLLLAAGVAGTSLAHPRPDFLHVCQGLVLWIPAIVCLLATAPRSRRMPAYVVTAGVTLFCAALLLQLPYTSRLETPRARLALPAEQQAGIEQALDWMQANVPPGEPVAVFPHGAMYYFLLERPVPGRFAVTLPPQIAGDRGRAAAQGFEAAGVGTLIWLRHGYPGLSDFEIYGAELAAWARRHFEIAWVQPAPHGLGDQLWILRRRAQPDPG